MSHHNTPEDVWNIIEDFNTAMLTTERAGQLRSRPMHVQIDKDAGEIRFLTQAQSGKNNEIKADHDVNVAFVDDGDHNYVSVSGRAEIRRDQKIIDDLWSDMAEAWFQTDKTDPSVTAVCVKPSTAEYWDAPSSTIVRTWDFMKSKVTGERPDDGEHAKVDMNG